MGDAEYMIDNGLDPFMKKRPDGLLEEWEGGLNPLYCDKLDSIEEIDVKINKSHLICLNKDVSNNYLYIDYIPIKNPLRVELDKLYWKCDPDNYKYEDLNSLLDSNPKFRDVLKKKDFCRFLDRPYQEIEDDDAIEFVYDKNLTKEDKLKEMEVDAKHLMSQLQDRDLPYAVEKTYEDITDGNVLAISHCMRGWAYPEFKLIDKFDVQFLTNFGYGNVSYFYVKLKFSKVDLVPFSDWVVYSDGDLYEIIRYSKKLCLENSSWYEAMKYVKDAVNLFTEDKEKFIQKYILGECELLLNGLEYILNDSIEFPYFSKFHREYDQEYKFDSRWLLTKYRGEKITGALNFITNIEAFAEITDIRGVISRIKGINFKFQPILLNEIGVLKIELQKSKEDLCAVEVIYNKVKLTIEPIDNIKKRINKIIKIRKSKDTSDRKITYNVLEELFNKKYPNYLKLKSEYNEISSEYYSAKKLVSELELFHEKFDKYSDKITACMDGR